MSIFQLTWKTNKRRRLEALVDVPREMDINQSSPHSLSSSGQSVASSSHVIASPPVVRSLSSTPTETLATGTLICETLGTLSFVTSGTLSSVTSGTLTPGTLTEMNNRSEVNYSINKVNNETPYMPDIASSRDINCRVPVDGDLLGAINSDSFCEATTLITSENAFTQGGLNQALLAACRRGHKLVVQTLVRDGANIEHRDEHGNTPLLICAENGFLDIVQFLVSRHANTKAVNYDGNTALILSVRPAGFTALTKFLLEQREVDIHHENNNGHTALNRATQFMDVDTMRLLLEKGKAKNTEMTNRYQNGNDIHFYNSRSLEIKQQATVDKTRLRDVYAILKEHLSTETSPLELAIKAGDTKSFDIFLDCQFSSREEKKGYIDKALVYMFQEYQHTTMNISNSTHVNILRKLLQHGADVNQGYRLNLSLAVKSGNFQVVELLCAHGAHMGEHYTDDPLFIAAKLGRPDLIELLLKYKADINRFNFSASALHCALRNDHTECAKLLIQRGAKMDVKSALRYAIDQQVSKYMHFLFENYKREILDYFSQQPLEARMLLTSAAKKENCEIIGQILDAGVGVNEADSTGQTPLMVSKKREVAEFLIQRGADITREIEGRKSSDAVLSSVIKNSWCKDKSIVEFCKVLIKNGASVNCRSGDGETPLMMAAAQDDCVDMLQMLLDNGADVNDRDNKGNTALFHAVRRQNCKIVTFLIKNTAIKNLINIQNKDGITPLILSVQNGDVSIVKELLQNGAGVNIKDNRENIALHHLLIACPRNRKRILTSLLKADSNVDWQNSGGLSPLMLAAKRTLPSVMSSLLEAGAKVNAVSMKNNSQTALSFLSKCHLGSRKKISCIETLLDGGADCSYLNHECIHKLISGNYSNLIFKLIQQGLGPADIHINKKQMKIRIFGAPPTVSPLYFALLLGKVHLARYFVDILFLTSSDLSMFASNEAMECLLPRDNLEDSVRLLQELSSQPMPLIKLSLVSVSAAVGSSPGRKARVNLLPLPQMMKDMLLFKSSGYVDSRYFS